MDSRAGFSPVKLPRIIEIMHFLLLERWPGG